MWLALALVGFVLFFVAVVALLRLGFDANGCANARTAKFGALVAVSLMVWLVALRFVAPPYPLEEIERYIVPE